MTGVWNWQIAAESLPHLMAGLGVTLTATAGGMGLALVGGMVLAVFRRARTLWVAWPTAVFIEFVRSTPLLIQLFLVYFLLPDWGWNTPLITGILILGAHYSTYTSEAYRAGIESVDRGQWEAAAALNLSPRRTWTRIIIPQAVPPVIPALGNYLIAMLKDTPLLYAITIQEILLRSYNFNSRVGSSVESYTLVGLIFLALSLGAAYLVRHAEKKLVRRES